MFRDLGLSRDLMGSFYQGLDEESSLRKMTAMVLQRSSWPFAARKANILLPRWVNNILPCYLTYTNVAAVSVDARRSVHFYTVLQGEASGPDP